MKEKDDYFTPHRMKRAVRRLTYINRWIDEELGEKKSIDNIEIDKESGFLAKLLGMLGVKKVNDKR